MPDHFGNPTLAELHSRAGIGRTEAVPMPIAGQSPRTVSALRSDEKNAFGHSLTPEMDSKAAGAWVASDTSGLQLPPAPTELKSHTAQMYMREKLARVEAGEVPTSAQFSTQAPRTTLTEWIAKQRRGG